MAMAAPIRAAIPQRTRWPLTELSASFDFERPFQPDIFRRTPHHQIVCARSYHEFLRLLVIEREAGSRQAERNGLLLFRLQSNSLEAAQFLGRPFHAGLHFVERSSLEGRFTLGCTSWTYNCTTSPPARAPVFCTSRLTVTLPSARVVRAESLNPL